MTPWGLDLNAAAKYAGNYILFVEEVLQLEQYVWRREDHGECIMQCTVV